MANQTKRYKCEECGLEYWEQKWAKECQAWCIEHKSCNIEVIKHAIKPDQE